MSKLPFGILPGHWGLAGKTREVAKAEYELSGYELKLRLLEIKRDEMSEDKFELEKIELDFNHSKITEREYHRKLAETIKDDKQKALALLELDYRDGKIKEIEYQKAVATTKNEPWVNVVNMDFTQKSALEGSFELDWNQAFVDKLKAEGYVGPTPDNIVNQWFMELCRNIAMEEFDGTGDFAADSEANLDAMKRWNSESFPAGRKGYS